MEELARFTLRNVLERSARLFGTNKAVSFLDSAGYTYRELSARAAAAAVRLSSLGIGSGDRVVLLSENRPEWCGAYFAVTAMGAVVVPVLTDFHRDEILNIIRHSEAKAVFVSAKMYEKIERSGIAAKILLVENLEPVPSDCPASALPSTPERAAPVPDPTDFSSYPEPSPDDLAAVIYTSGTTGSSKGVMLTHGNIVSNAVSTLRRVMVTPEDVLLSILPLAHTYECTLGFITPMIAGASVYYLDKPPVASVLVPALAKVRPTFMLSVPLVIEKIYKSRIQPELSHSPVMRTLMAFRPTRILLSRIAGKKLLKTFGGRLVFFGIGGSKLAPDVERFLRDARFPYAIGYGLTETSPLLAGCDAAHTKYQSTGPAIEGVELRLSDPDPVTGEGEIQVRGPNVMKGYYKDPEKTAEAFTKDGWFRTGDLGITDSDGYVFIRGRIKNMLLGPSGENIYPEDIEATINRFPVVQESLVVQSNGKLVALIRFNYEELSKRFNDIREGFLEKQKQGMEFLNELRKEVNSKLNSFSRISHIREQQEPFEKTPTNKIKRYRHVMRD